MAFLDRVRPTCLELAQRLARGEYERAPWWERLGVRWHLFRCELCDKYARQLRLVADGLRRRSAQQAGDADLEAVKRRLRERLR